MPNSRTARIPYYTGLVGACPQYTGPVCALPPMRSREVLMIVVVQLVLTLRMHPLRALPLITFLRGTHRKTTGAGRLDRRERKKPFQLFAFTLRTRRGLFSADESLERVSAALAGVFVDRYDGTPILESDLCSVPRYAEH